MQIEAAFSVFETVNCSLEKEKKVASLVHELKLLRRERVCCSCVAQSEEDSSGEGRGARVMRGKPSAIPSTRLFFLHSLSNTPPTLSTHCSDSHFLPIVGAK